MLLLAATDSVFASSPTPNILKVLSWYGYFSPDLIEHFEVQYDADVEVISFSSDHDRDGLVIDSDGRGFDLAIVDEVSIELYARQGWLQALSRENIPNLRYIDPHWGRVYPALRVYAAPYLWGTTGIIYRTDLVNNPIESWKQIFNPDDSLSGRIVMLNDPTDLYEAALYAAGSAKTPDDKNTLDQVEQLLVNQRPHVKRYGYIKLDEHSELISGEIVAAHGFNGDYYTLADFNDNLEFVLPVDGCSLWIDSIVMFASTDNPTLSEQFIDYFNRPDVAAVNAQTLNFATPNLSAEKLLPKDFLMDQVIYPGSLTLNRCMLAEPMSDSASLRMNKIHNLLIR